jgi:hypothetical protein
MIEEELLALDVVMSPLFNKPQVSGVFEIKECGVYALSVDCNGSTSGYRFQSLVCIDEELCYCLYGVF